MTEARHPHPHYPVRSLPFGPVSAPGALIMNGDALVAGWLITESTGAAVATGDIIDGVDATGVPSGPINLAASGVANVQFGGHALILRTGLFVAVTAGSVRGVLYLADA